MKSTLRESRDDQDVRSAGGTHAELIGELSKSVSRLRSLPMAEYGDTSAAHLEHTLDAILNMAQKTTFDDSTLDSLRVSRPVQKRNRRVRENSGPFACGLRLLLCGKNEAREDEYRTVFPDLTSIQSKFGSKSKGSFWKEERSKSPEKGEIRYVGSHPQEPQKGDCGASNGYSTHSKQDLVVAVGRKHEDDISSLSSDLFMTRRSYAYDTSPVIVAGAANGNQCFGHYEDVLSCRTQHRQLPIEENHCSFLDLLTCHRSPGERHERLRDEQETVPVDDDHDMKILGLRKKGDELSSIRSSSVSAAQSQRSLEKLKSQSKISRVEAEHTPSSVADQTKPEKATLLIQSNQSRKAKR